MENQPRRRIPLVAHHRTPEQTTTPSTINAQGETASDLHKEVIHRIHRTYYYY